MIMSLYVFVVLTVSGPVCTGFNQYFNIPFLALDSDQSLLVPLSGPDDDKNLENGDNNDDADNDDVKNENLGNGDDSERNNELENYLHPDVARRI